MSRKRRYIISAAIGAACVCIALGVLAMLLRDGPGVTKANFDRIQEGMTRAEVEAILGKPDMEHQAARWGHGDGARIAIAFDENDKVEGRRFDESTETIPAKLRRWLGLPEAPPRGPISPIFDLAPEY